MNERQLSIEIVLIRRAPNTRTKARRIIRDHEIGQVIAEPVCSAAWRRYREKIVDRIVRVGDLPVARKSLKRETVCRVVLVLSIAKERISKRRHSSAGVIAERPLAACLPRLLKSTACIVNILNR